MQLVFSLFVAAFVVVSDGPAQDPRVPDDRPDSIGSGGDGPVIRFRAAIRPAVRADSGGATLWRALRPCFGHYLDPATRIGRGY